MSILWQPCSIVYCSAIHMQLTVVICNSSKAAGSSSLGVLSISVISMLMSSVQITQFTWKYCKTIFSVFSWIHRYIDIHLKGTLRYNTSIWYVVCYTKKYSVAQIWTSLPHHFGRFYYVVLCQYRAQLLYYPLVNINISKTGIPSLSINPTPSTHLSLPIDL